MLLQAVLLGSAALAMNTGEKEEDRVEQLVPEARIEAHEEAAESFLWASAVVLALMLLPVALPEGRARRAASFGAFLGTPFVFGFGYVAGEAGGKLVYEHGAAQATPGTGTPPPSAALRTIRRMMTATTSSRALGLLRQHRNHGE